MAVKKNIGMSDEFQSFDQRAMIKVCGIGGGGGNAVTRMVEAGLAEVEFITINTDAQALKSSPAGIRLQIGLELTGGLGSGAIPDTGRKAAEEDRERIKEVVRGADMIFLTIGLGGGTGTGAGPVVAEEASNAGALTVGICTLPFGFEGKERMANAMRGLAELEKFVDTLIVVPNDRVAELSQNNISLLNAFRQADEVLYDGVRAITELITVPGLINLDFADVRTIMQRRGRALMGIGAAIGEDRAVRAAREAIVCPLLEQSNINGAMGVVVNIAGGCDITMREVQAAVSTVKEAAHPDANVIFGAVIAEEEQAEVQVTVIAAGFPKGAADISPSAPFGMLEPAESFDDIFARPAPVPAPPVATPSPAPEPAPSYDHEFEVSPPGTPAEQYLFPEAETRPAEPAKGSDGEDLDIPAFLRRRMKKRNS